MRIRKYATALVTAAAVVACAPSPATAAQPRNTLIWAQVQASPGDNCQFSTTGPRRGGVLECSSGLTAKLKPLRDESGPRGYWLADYRGNGQGDSFVQLRGRTLYVTCWIDHPTRDTVAEGACQDTLS